MNHLRLLLAAAVLGLATAAAAGSETPVEQAKAAITRGEFTHAEDLLTPLVRRGRSEAAALYYMSVVRLAQKRYEEAVDFGERATKADPTKPDYFAQLGRACNARITELGPLDGDAMAKRMRKAYERALKLEPNHLEALVGLMHFYEKAPEIVGGNPKKAAEVAEHVRQLDPYTGEVELGRLASGEKKYAEALAHYDAAVKLQPNDLATATASGWTLFALGRKEEARARFEAVLKRDPDFEPAKMGFKQTSPPAK